MFHKFRFIATLACLSLSFSLFAEDLVFINDDLRTGLNRAAGEGKLVFLEFWASYCTPCKMMEEYTFTNASVIERMTNNYVPVKVNIQSFDGFDLKNQYKVTVLPTIIILDSKGRLVGRYEETMGATKLNAVLDKHNLPQNRMRPAALAYNTSFNAPANKVTSSTTPSVSAPVSSRLPATYNNAPQRKPVTATLPANTVPVSYTNAPQRKPVTATLPANTVPVSYNNAPQRKPVAAMPSTNTAIETGQRREIPTNGFTIQAGAYGQAAGAQTAVDEIKSKIGNQKQYIMQSKTATGKTTYRILIGNFTSRQQADAFRKKAAIEGFIRGFDDFAKK